MERRGNKTWNDGGVLAMLAESSSSEDEMFTNPPDVLVISKCYDLDDDDQHELSLSSINSKSLPSSVIEKRFSSNGERGANMESDNEDSSFEETFSSNDSTCHAGSESTISDETQENNMMVNIINRKGLKNSKENFLSRSDLKDFISSPLSDDDNEQNDRNSLDESDYEPEGTESSDSDATCSESMDSEADEVVPKRKPHLSSSGKKKVHNDQNEIIMAETLSLSTNIVSTNMVAGSPRENLLQKFSFSPKLFPLNEKSTVSRRNRDKTRFHKPFSARKKMKAINGDQEQDLTENDSLIEVCTGNESDDYCDELVAEVVDDNDCENLKDDAEAMVVNSFFSSDKENIHHLSEDNHEESKPLPTIHNSDTKKLDHEVDESNDAPQDPYNVDSIPDFSKLKKSNRAKKQKSSSSRASNSKKANKTSRQDKGVPVSGSIQIMNVEGQDKNTGLPKSRHRRDGSIRQGMWVLGAKIGSGAFGTVHIGLNTATGTLMAVKSVKMDPSVMRDVRREVELLKSLNHINIVRYYGAEIDSQYLHIFQEWVPAGSVTLMLQKFGPFPIAVLRTYLLQTLKGLSYLHENNIMHRDIKGSNILVSDGGIVKLADFGASKRFASIEQNMMLSLTMRGTPYFMAPEVFQEKYCMKADIWSVGCVAFQMVVGTPPWKNLGFSNPISLFQHLQNVKDPPPMQVPNEEAILLSKNGQQKLDMLRNCVARCFARNPVDRPSADEMICDNFFSNQALWNDPEQADSLGLFSPSPQACKKTLPSHNSEDLSPIQRNAGLQQTAFLSPQIPQQLALPYSPPPDTSEWPTWARERHIEAKGATEAAELSKMMNSLAFSEDSNPSVPTNPIKSMEQHRLALPPRIHEETQRSSPTTLHSSLIGTKFA